MKLYIVDRARTTRIKNTVWYPNAFDTTREALSGHPIQNGQIEIECDAEFRDALIAEQQKRHDAGEPYALFLAVDKDGSRMIAFDRIPVRVLGEVN